MKLQKNLKEKSQVLGASMAKEFSIDTSNQMIVSILRDKLYANKVAAVCREVSSNSRDANREAGRAEAPVVISISDCDNLLGDEGLQISFKDSGIGISPERIENVFLKYGSSTKRDTNNQTGGFGIGAKTPFAYSKEFLVSTVSEHNGKTMKHIYQAIILNDNGLESSQLILVSEEETSEKTGTEIIVPIKTEDRNEFEFECVKATALWEIKPILNGFVNYQHPELKTLLSGNNWSLVSGVYNQSLFDTEQDMFFLEVDGIPYVFNPNNIPDSNPNKNLLKGKIYRIKDSYHYSSSRRNLILKFSTGELTLSASREAVETTSENIDLIAAKYAVMIDELLEEGRKKYKKLKTDIDRISFYNNIRNASSNELESFFQKFRLAEELSEEFVKLKTLPKNLLQLGGRAYDFFVIDGDDNRWSTAKKYNSNDTLIRNSIIENSIFVLRKSNERSNYRKNITIKNMLEEENKSHVIFLIEKISVENLSDQGIDKKNNSFTTMTNLLKEKDVSIIEYSEIESAKVERSATNRERKPVDKERGTLYVRTITDKNQISLARWENSEYSCNKTKLKYFKSSKKIDRTSINFEFEENKLVLIPLNTFSELSDMDRKSGKLTAVIKESENSQKIGETYISSRFLAKILLSYGYKIIFYSASSKNFISKEKCHNSLNEAFLHLTKNKSFIKDVSELRGIKDVYDLEAVGVDSDEYRMYTSKLGINVLKLIDIDISEYKFYGEKKSEQNLSENKFSNIHNTHSFKEESNAIVDKFGKSNKKIKEVKYVSSTFLEGVMEILAKKYPLIHNIFEPCIGANVWTYDEYDVTSRDGSGLAKIKSDLERVVNMELERKNIVVEKKRGRGRPKGSKNKK